MKRKLFFSIDTAYSNYNSQDYSIVRQLDESEVDKKEVGNMYEIKLDCGKIINVFEDEIFDYAE